MPRPVTPMMSRRSQAKSNHINDEPTFESEEHQDDTSNRSANEPTFAGEGHQDDTSKHTADGVTFAGEDNRMSSTNTPLMS